ncbi:MAG: prepilin-type N-terminal cleavage/methylation domain-containing protein [Trueperaceae bacterium]
MTRRGLSLVEVIIALAVVAIAFAILSTALVGQLRFSGNANARTQTTQYLNYLGRLVAGGAEDVLPAAGNTLTWDYGAMVAAFPDLPGGAGLDAAGRYRAEVESVGAVAYVGAIGVQYRVRVCSVTPTGESCAAATTIGPAPAATGATPPPLPGIN